MNSYLQHNDRNQLIDARGNIIHNWLQRSNLHSTRWDVAASPQPPHYSLNTTLEEILLEGDVALEPFMLNPDTELARRFAAYCETSEQLPILHEALEILKEERDLWNLVDAIYTDRVQRGSEVEGWDGDKNNATDYQLVQRLLQSSGKMSDATQIVRSWLETTAPGFQPVPPRKGGWVATKLAANAFPNRPESVTDIALTELDPDAPWRQGKRLEPDDEFYEETFLKSLFGFIRRGKIEQAIALAVSCDQSWRAASIRGGLYFRDPQLELHEDGVSSDFEYDAYTVRGEDDSDMPAGNPNRTLWKCACYTISSEPVGGKYERALYAVLCGDLENKLLRACDSWEDYLWAYYTCLLESRIEKFFRDNGRTGDTAGLTPPPLLELEEAEIFERLENAAHPNVSHRSQDVYSQIKKHIILNSLNTLLAELATKIRQPDPGESGVKFQTVRFLALLVLYLRSVGFIDRHPDADTILRHYVTRLSKLNIRLAILYCSKLPHDQQVDAYASLLSGIDAPLPTRMECLRYGCMYGLNFDQVLLVAAEHVAADPRHFHLTTRCPEIPDTVRLQIRAFEWIDHDATFYPNVLLMCNKACRRFLGAGQLWVVGCLLEVMPSDLVPQDRVLEEDAEGNPLPHHLIQAAQEYMNYVILVEAFAQVDEWREAMRAKPNANAGALRAWEQEVKAMTHKAEQALKYALNANWMFNCFPTEAAFDDPITAETRAQAAYLRQIYLPELTYALVDVLMETRDLLPGNVRKAFDVSELVANETLGIYKAIMRRPTLTETYNDLPALLDRLGAIGTLLLGQEELQPSPNTIFPPLGA
ncbi:Nucleoporin nup84 [Massospora cicadina]|nr:Nucleoporin nup84 [Massospora cicadina]